MVKSLTGGGGSLSQLSWSGVYTSTVSARLLQPLMYSFPLITRGWPFTTISSSMFLHVVQLKVMAVGTVGCGVVDLCGSNAYSFLVLKSTISIGCLVLFVVACKNNSLNIMWVVVLHKQLRLYYFTHKLIKGSLVAIAPPTDTTTLLVGIHLLIKTIIPILGKWQPKVHSRQYILRHNYMYAYKGLHPHTVTSLCTESWGVSSQGCICRDLTELERRNFSVWTSNCSCWRVVSSSSPRTSACFSAWRRSLDACNWVFWPDN